MQPDSLKALRILQQLIRIRTPQPVGDELDAVKYIVSLLHADRFRNRVLYHGHNRASLITEIKGAGRSPKVALVGNLDTVGVEDIDSWAHPPYAADYERGRVFGRGASNDKGGVTAILLAALALADADTPPPCDVAFCFTADNDRGAIGASSLIESGFFEDVGEMLFAQPTDIAIGIGQKGLLWLDVQVEGRSAHVTQPSIGVNAFTAFIDLHRRVEAIFSGEPEHPLLGHSLSNITKISGFGPAAYSIPDKATGRIDIRFPPNVDVDHLYGQILEIAGAMMQETRDLRIALELVKGRAAIGMTSSAPIVRKLKRIYKKLRLTPNLIGLSYFTDASILVPKLGVPFAIVGPGEDIYGRRGDESIELESVVKAARVYLEFIRNR